MQTGAIRIIATINDGRSKYFPDVPTMAEQGYAEAQVTPWFGIVVPAGTPRADRRAYQQGAGGGACDRGGAREARHRRMRAEERAAAQFADIIKADVALWAKVVKDAGITAD